MAQEKKLSTADKLKIINSDVEKWLFNFVKITDAENKLIPFKVNPAQKDFLNKRDKYNIILKSRQLGFSTLSLGIMLYYAYQIPNSTYLMVAHDSRSLRELFNRLKLMANSIPKQYRMTESKNNRDELEFKENGSRIIVQCPTDGLGAGMTLQMVHLSEYALYSELHQSQALATVEQSLAKNKDSMIIIESTAKGMQNNHYRVWQDSYKGRSRYKPFFYGWTTKSHLDLFRYEVDLAVEWYKSINKGKRLSSDPLELTSYERMLLEKTDVTLLQLMWRQWKLTSMKQNDFYEHFPAFPEESFIATDNGVFDAEIVSERANFLPEPFVNVKGLPLSLQRYLKNGLYIYEEPKPKEWYFAGVDTALGNKNGGDDSAMIILNSNGEEVAVFNRNDIPTYRFVDIIYDLANFYNTANIMVERNSYGIDVLQRLHKEKQYVNLSRTRRTDKITGRRKWELGWYNDSVSKTILISDLRESFETGLILVNNKETIEQMKLYQENKGKFGNISGTGNKDDLVDCLGLAVQSMKLGRYYH